MIDKHGSFPTTEVIYAYHMTCNVTGVGVILKKCDDRGIKIFIKKKFVK